MRDKVDMASGTNEFDIAWEEYFKDKPNPKNDEEDKKQMGEFAYWYNHVRKQSDTEKTPAEMYKEVYGKEPPEKVLEPSRMTNFEWGEDYDEELIGWIYELQEYDNEVGYKLEYDKVKKKLKPVIECLVEKGEKALDLLHDLLNKPETWSCLFALEILMEIKSEKSILYLIDFIVKNEKEDFGEICEGAMFALTNIGESAIQPLMKEVKNQFGKKKFHFYLTGALTEIKNERVYDFMKEITEDYLGNEEKYDEWFHIDCFTSDFFKQDKKEILLLLKNLASLDSLSKHERIEILDTIKVIEDPIHYKQKLKEESEKLRPIVEKYLEEESDCDGKNKKGTKIDKEEFNKRMRTREDDLEVQFKCCECNKKQNINPGIIKALGDKDIEFSFENEIMCKYCFSNDIKLTKDGGREILFQSIGTFMGNRQGVISTESDVYVEDKKMPFKKTYNYILKRIKEEPENGELYLRAGNVARNFNKYSEAIKHYEKAILLDPKLIASYLNLVELYEFRYEYYKIEDAKTSAIFYLNEMMDIFRTGDFDSITVHNKNEIVQFLGEKSESLGVNFPELFKMDARSLKIGRNAPCPCGSGKKYKKCCLMKEDF